MTSSFSHFGIIGAGAWGTALALVLHRAGRQVTLTARDSAFAATLAEKRENMVYLPGARLPPSLTITANPADLLGCNAVILAVPSQYLRATCKAIAPVFAQKTPLILACKGIELGSHKLMSEVVAETLPGHPLYILSGPSIAGEVAQNLPVALTLASEHSCSALAQAMTTPTFRLYTTDDIIGTQIGGALKNVLAIACGIVAGRGLGDNARAALVTRGLAEIMRLATALGARSETVMGLSGLGDVVLCCASIQSRNMSLGFELGQGKSLDSILSARAGITEGVTTTTAALNLAYHHGVDMPVVSAVDMILRGQASIDSVIENILARPLRHEAA